MFKNGNSYGANVAQLAIRSNNSLDQVVAATRPQSDKEAERAKDYFRQFLEQVVKPGQVVSKDVEKTIKFWITKIDEKLSAVLQKLDEPSLSHLVRDHEAGRLADKITQGSLRA